MYNFDYLRPASLAEAMEAMKGEDAQAISGGQTLIPTLKARLASPSVLVDLSGLAELKGVSREGDKLAIGAATRHADVAGSEAVRSAIPALAATPFSRPDRARLARGEFQLFPPPR